MFGRVGAGQNWKNKILTANAALTQPQSLVPKQVRGSLKGKEAYKGRTSRICHPLLLKSSSSTGGERCE